MLRYTAGMSRTPGEVSAEVRAQFSDEQVFELTGAIALENSRRVFNCAPRGESAASARDRRIIRYGTRLRAVEPESK